MNVRMRTTGLVVAVLLMLVGVSGCGLVSTAKTEVSKLTGTSAATATPATGKTGAQPAPKTLALPHDNEVVVGSACTMDDKAFGSFGRVLAVGYVMAKVNMHYSTSCGSAWATLDEVVSSPYLPITLVIQRMPAGAKDCTGVGGVGSKPTTSVKGAKLLASTMLGVHSGTLIQTTATYNQQGNAQVVVLCSQVP